MPEKMRLIDVISFDKDAKESAKAVIDRDFADKSHDEKQEIYKTLAVFTAMLYERPYIDHIPRPDWTPCDEGLPVPKDGVYDVTLNNRNETFGVVTAYVLDGEWVNTGMYTIENIIAYMPKPAPYRSDDTTGKVDHIRDATKKIHELKSPEQCTFRVRSVKDGHGDTERGNDWCNGYQKSEVDDEPCLTCQACKLCAANDQEED